MKVGSKLLGTKANEALTKLGYLLRKELPAGFDASLTSGWISLLAQAATHTDSEVQMQYARTCELIALTPLKQFVENQGIDLSPNASFGRGDAQTLNAFGSAGSKGTGVDSNTGQASAEEASYAGLVSTPILTEMVDLTPFDTKFSAEEQTPAVEFSNRRAVFEARDIDSVGLSGTQEITAINYSLEPINADALLKNDAKLAIASGANSETVHDSDLADEFRRPTLAERLGIAAKDEKSLHAFQPEQTAKYKRAQRLQQFLKEDANSDNSAFASKDPTSSKKLSNADKKEKGWSSLSRADFS